MIGQNINLLNTKELRSNEIKSIFCRPHILNSRYFNVSSANAARFRHMGKI